LRARPDHERVVVTGLGAVTSIGCDVGTFWRHVLEGHGGAAPITSFDTSAYKTHIGCEVRDFDAAAVLGADARHVGRASQLAIAAAAMALADAGWRWSGPARALQPAATGPPAPGRRADVAGTRAAGAAPSQPDLDPTRVAVSMGTTLGEAQVLEHMPESWEAWRTDSDVWSGLVHAPCSVIAQHVGAAFELAGPCATIPTACAAGNYAIAHAVELLRAGRADVAVAGGTDAFSRSAFTGFSRLHAMSPDMCRPFDRNRRGLLLGEGAGVLVLETLAGARRRGARVLAEVLGYGLSCDAYHITGPHPEGQGASAAMSEALANADIGPEDVSYINAHGTGTAHNDRIETLAIKKVFGARAHEIPVSSIKALTGHVMGGASAIEAIACVLAIQTGTIPPTWNYETPDPDCDLDYVPNAPRAADVRVAVNNSYAFGGNNASVILGAVT
jgi:3-oxoacyl-[acyl-carrier-protein] synthase II